MELSLIHIFVALELLGMRAYRRHRARKQAAFTRENVGAVYDDLQAARARCLAEKRAFALLADAARSAGRPEDGAVLDALAAGERAHLAALEAFRGPLHAESVEPEPRPPQPSSLDDAPVSYTHLSSPCSSASWCPRR